MLKYAIYMHLYNMQIKYANICKNIDSICYGLDMHKYAKYAKNMHKYATKHAQYVKICKNMHIKYANICKIWTRYAKTCNKNMQ